MAKYVLDSDIVSAILRKDQGAARGLREALTSNHSVVICSVVYYEVKRGLLYKDARNQLGDFEQFVRNMDWRDVEKPDWEEAAQIWSSRMKRGQRIDVDADILISAVARIDGAVVVTRNTRHFSNLGLTVLSWN